MVSGGYTGSASEVKELVRAFRAYDGTLGDIQDIVSAASDAAKNLDLPYLRQAGLRLNQLAPRGNGLRGVQLRFAEKAPKKLYPERSVVLGGLLADLNASPNPRVRAFANELGLAWFRQEAVPHGIRGKDFYV